MKMINKTSSIPFYVQIKDEIIKFARKYDSAQALPKHEELARIFGTSRFTVAKAVSELKEEKILKAVKGKGTYIIAPHSTEANSAVIEKKKIITLILPSGEISPIFQSCQEEAEKEGYHILLENTHLPENRTRENFIRRERELLIKYRDGEFGDSLIIYYEGGQDNIDILKDIIAADLPVVFVDRLPDNLPGNYVGYDNYTAGRETINRLIKSGKTNIAIIATGTALSPVQEKIAGYIKAFEDNNLPFNKENIITGVDYVYYYREEEVSEIRRRFQQIKDKIDAIYFTSPFPESIILGRLNESDLKADIVMAGQGSVLMPWIEARYAICLKHPIFQLGREAVKLVKAKLSSENRTRIEQIKLPVRLYSPNENLQFF
ncbi:MAG: LacI family DNA-binding transcriptional regulator [Victivallaceae bacterium]|nr:LacI family DNA-binding transcriptional regulator [Victivallaceae bacterium]